jgi:Family of unknown function (DUF6049)
MKHFFKFHLLLLTTLLTLLFGIITSPETHAASSSLLFITAPSHRTLSGAFLNDQLASEISPVGSIGRLLYLKNSQFFQWEVDPALVEEVIDMSDGYKLVDGSTGAGQDFAKNFLDQLKSLALIGRVDAMVYGNPSEYWVQRLTPHEHNYILSASQRKLESLLGVPVGTPTSYVNRKYFSLSRQSVLDIRDDYNTIQSSAIYMDPSDLDKYRLSLTRLFNPAMSKNVRSALTDDFNGAVLNLSKSIRLAPGHFTITSSAQKLPITVINDFPNPAKVNLSINSLNEKIQVGDISNITVPGKSKVQVLVPIKVLTSGSSALVIVVQNRKGDSLSDPQIYSLSLAVISPIATWITTGAAIILFCAALLQSLRRIRRRRAG